MKTMFGLATEGASCAPLGVSRGQPAAPIACFRAAAVLAW